MTSSRPESEGDQRNNHSSETRTDTDNRGLVRFPLWGWHHAWFSVKNDPSGGPAVATVLTIGTSIPVILNPCCKDKLCTAESYWNTTRQQTQSYYYSQYIIKVIRSDDIRCRATSGRSVTGFCYNDITLGWQSFRWVLFLQHHFWPVNYIIITPVWLRVQALLFCRFLVSNVMSSRHRQCWENELQGLYRAVGN